jgi:xanthine dehydrogenase accessory factor
MSWLDQARRAISAGEPAVLVTVVAVQGSAPREPGARLLVLRDRVVESIGGGHLEFAATAAARIGQPRAHSETIALGPQLGQCCGGKVRLLFEPLAAGDLGWLAALDQLAAAGDAAILVRRVGLAGSPLLLRPQEIASAVLPAEIRQQARDFAESSERIALVERETGEAWLFERSPPAPDRLQLFGAGHVGAALVQALANLHFRVEWIDDRSGLFPATLPANVRTSSATPADAVAAARAGDFYLVMTHSHPLDLEICEKVLRRGDFAFLGLIGSETKRARFVSRLRARGLPPDLVQRLTCPIGIPEIAGKHPTVIALSVAAQLVALSEAVRARTRQPQGHAG